MDRTVPVAFTPSDEATSLDDLAQATLNAAVPLACRLADRAARSRDAADARLATDALHVAIGAWVLAEDLAKRESGCLA